MLRAIARATGTRLARRAGFARGRDARWRAAFSTTGEDDGDAAEGSAEAGDADDAGPSGDDASSADAANEEDDAAPSSDAAPPPDAPSKASRRFPSGTFESEELSVTRTGASKEEVKMVAVRPTHQTHDELLEKDGWLLDATEQGHTVTHNPNIRNAHLSDRTKTQMFLMHEKDPETWDVARLAEQYRIRQQRVMAILALKKIQQRHLRDGKPTFPDLEAAFEELHGSEDRGSGERHFHIVPSLPKFQVVPAHTSEEELAKILPPFVSDAEKAEREERELVRTFRENLRFNLGEDAPSLNRRGRIKKPGKRPEGGYGLMVIPMVNDDSKKAHARARREGRVIRPERPYVASRDGTRRALNEDEEIMLRRRRSKPRRKII
jgi:hypothetical protein